MVTKFVTDKQADRQIKVFKNHITYCDGGNKNKRPTSQTNKQTKSQHQHARETCPQSI